jgi:hypothetical protein
MPKYGPGQYTRCFIAQTFEQPSAYAPLACVKHAKDTFEEALLDGISNTLDAVQAVASRIVAFCKSSLVGWGLMTERETSDDDHPLLIRLQSKESMLLVITNFVDKSESNAMVIPPSLVEALQGQDNSQLLPDIGHFVIQVTV